jgi:hypothetical protein
MILFLIPQGSRPELPWMVAGDTLTIGGDTYDFSAVPDGGSVDVPPPPGGEHRFVGPVRREGGVLHLTAIYHIDDTAETDQPGTPWVLDVADGAVVPPVLRRPAPQDDGDAE